MAEPSNKLDLSAIDTYAAYKATGDIKAAATELNVSVTTAWRRLQTVWAYRAHQDAGTVSYLQQLATLGSLTAVADAEGITRQAVHYALAKDPTYKVMSNLAEEGLLS